MKKIFFFAALVLLIFVEYYLRLVFSFWPVVLVPVVIILFTVSSAKNPGNLSIIVASVFVYELFSPAVFGVGVISFFSIMAVFYLLSTIIDFANGYVMKILAVLLGTVVYMEINYLVGWLLLNRVMPDFIFSSPPSLGLLLIVLGETVCFLFVIALVKFAYNLFMARRRRRLI